MKSDVTKQMLAAGFTKLLNQMPLNKISVLSIAETCGVNRNTFYYHFDNIEGLIDYMFNQEAAKMDGNTTIYNNAEEALSNCLRYAFNNKQAVYHLYHSEYRDILAEYLRKVADKMLDNFVQFQCRDLSVSLDDQQCVSHFYRDAIMGYVADWLQGDMRRSLDEELRRCSHLFEGSVRWLLERASADAGSTVGAGKTGGTEKTDTTPSNG